MRRSVTLATFRTLRFSSGAGPADSLRVSPERERWACAQTLIRQHGRRAVSHANFRIADRGEAGDQAGVEVWLDILKKIVILLRERDEVDTLQ